MTHNQLKSTSKQPDLDWSQVRETINMLTLAVAQIETTMKDGEQSVSELTESFTYIASELQQLTMAGEELRSSSSDHGNSIKTIENSAEIIRSRISSAIMAFQFYDRLTQRLDHVKRDLRWLSDLISNPSTLYNPLAWHRLQEDIMSNYTMEEERLMFQHIMSGISVEDALEVYKHSFKSEDPTPDNTGDEIELF
ncbi:MAG: hypothetical protein H7A00_08780 [Hahellaceae bacterium]|nr:hypothetical protein [Hahellaceae bacterium]